MTTVDEQEDAQAAPVATEPIAKVARNAVIDRIVAGLTYQRNLIKAPDIADLILADLQRLGYGELWRHALPAVRALQRLSSMEWLTTPTGDDVRDNTAETRARAELARTTLAGMGIPWRRRT
jgi:hypothetical protein